MSHDELSEKYHIRVSFLQVLQIRSSLPFYWRRLLTGQTNPNLSATLRIGVLNDSTLDISKLSSKKLCSNIILKKQHTVASQRKWDLEFPPPAEKSLADYWHSNYMSAFWSVRETKIQAFQFKVLHRLIPCNKYLKNIRIKESDLCTFCGEVDTLTHFLFQCSHVQRFWSALCNWTSQNINITLEDISVREYMLGTPKEKPQARAINFILLSCKFYIYRQKLYHNASMELVTFLHELRMKLKIEQYICALEGKADKFHTWRYILNALG